VSLPCLDSQHQFCPKFQFSWFSVASYQSSHLSQQNINFLEFLVIFGPSPANQDQH